MCDKENCNCGSNPCCGDCEPWNCVEQAVNDVWSTKEGQIEELVERAETAAENSEASAKASADSAAEAKEFRDEAEQAATTAVAAEGVVVGVANDLQDTANKLEQIADELNTAISGIAVSTWYYTAVSDNQTVIPVPADKNEVDIQSIYIEGVRQEPNRGFVFDKLARTITLAEGIPLGLEISIIMGTYSDNSNDFASTLASENGASLVGTKSGKTVQSELEDKVTFLQGQTVLHVPSEFPSINAALAYLKNKSFDSMTIEVADGIYDSDTILLSHPDLERLTIQGVNAPKEILVTGGSVVSGSAGLYIYQFNVPEGHGIIAGDIVAARDFIGNPGLSLLYGALRVVSVTTTSVNVQIRYYGASFPTLTFTSGKLFKFHVQLKFKKTDGIVIRGDSLGLMQNIAVVGNMWDYWNASDVSGTEVGSHGIYVGSNTIVDGAATPGGANPNAIAGGSISLRWVAVLDFDQQGMCAANASAIFARYCFSNSNGRRGFYAGNVGSIDARQCVANHNYRDGVIADYGGAFNTSGFWASGNRLDGVFAINNGSMIAPNTVCEYNLAFGGEARTGSYISIDAGTLRFNGSGGLHAEYAAGISALGATISNNLIDGIQAYYSSAIRAVDAIISNNGRYNVYALGESAIACTLADISSPGSANFMNADSTINTGTSYVPKTTSTSSYTLSIVDSTQTHVGVWALTTAGNLVFSADGVNRITITPTVLYAPNGVMTVGRDADRMVAVFTQQLIFGTSGNRRLFTGLNSPEGNVSAPIGSIYINENGGAGTTMYVKESGTGNTGWVGK